MNKIVIEMKQDFIYNLTKQYNDFETTIAGCHWEIWEAIRFDLYYQIQNILMGVDITPAVKTKKSKLTSRLKNSILGTFKFIYESIKHRKHFVFLSVSRFKDENGANYDPNILDFYELLKDSSFIIENTYSDKYRYKVANNPVVGLLTRLYNRINQDPIPQELKNSVEKTFGVRPDWTLLTPPVNYYRAEKKFYSLFLRLYKPKAIFITQAGVQKGLFKAAKNNNIPIVEFQHGIVYVGHLNYSYSDKIARDRLTIPDYFITYSSFWTNKIKDTFPVKGILDCGNTAASTICTDREEKYQLTFICCTVFMKRFIQLIQEMQSHGYKGRICLKLHPQQTAERKGIEELFADNGLVDIVGVETSMKEIIGESKALITIQSTSAYEALDAGKPMIFIKEQSYEVHRDVFDNPLVKLVSDSDDIIKTLKQMDCPNNAQAPIRYFKPFDKAMCLSLLNELDITQYVK